MNHRLARSLFFLALGALGFALLGGTLPARPVAAPPAAASAKEPRIVYLAAGLGHEELVVLTAATAASDKPGVVLLDTPKASPYNKAFLAAYRPDEVIPVGSFPSGVVELERRCNFRAESAVAWKHGPPKELWERLFPKAETVVVCPAEPRGLLLQAACLAGVAHAPLFVSHGKRGEAEELARWVTRWKTKHVYAAGKAKAICRDLVDVRLTNLSTERAVAAAHVRRLAKDGPVRTLVVANPADGKADLGGMSDLAAYVALERKAALVLTGPSGEDAEDVVHAAVRRRELRQADALVFVASLKAIPMKERPNPVVGDKDKTIEMEPCTPAPGEPFTFATGRLFHDDLHVVALQMARQKLLAEDRGPRKALVASNAGNSLPLLETFSRSTVQELRNAGYETRALVGKDVTEEDLRRLLPAHHIFLWEGHHNTLIKDWKFPNWTEPLPPSLIFLQSCLALMEWKALPALERGAIGVVGSSTRTYSASGGACSLAFFNALLYEDASLGGALRQSKNFLTAYALLKEKRLGKDAKRTGANLRAAWAFTLWGDPTLKLPRPAQPDDALPPVEHEVRGNTIVVSLPENRLDKVRSAKYQAQVPANGRLAGLVRKTGDKDVNPLVPLVFTEIKLPKAPPGRMPKLHSRLPESNWIFLWDARRRSGYLLATPRARDTGELRFRVEWQPVESVGIPRPLDGGGE